MLGKINGHDLHSGRRSYYGGSTTYIWCSNEDCYIDVAAEHGASERARELAHENECPYDANTCIVCDNRISESADYCEYCALTVGRALSDKDEEGKFRREQ